MLVDDWKRAWTWFSIHVATIAALVGALQQALPALCPGPSSGAACAHLAVWLAPNGWFMVVFGFAVIAARLVNQNGNGDQPAKGPR